LFATALTSLPMATTPASAAPALFAQENLLAWCIVPYDAKHRGPAERIAMLQRLGFTQYVWDWRPQHLKDLPDELRLAQAAGVRMRGIWLWIDETQDHVGALSASNEAIFAAVGEAHAPMEFWVGFHDNVFEGLDDNARVAKGAALISHLRDRAAKVGGTIALYNHGGWFGEPENQLRIITAVGDDSVGMVYNFHHGHTQLDRFAAFLPVILPHLRAVNINGMRPEGPKILPVGSGTRERDMLRQLEAAGYRGPIGLLCHVDDADPEEILRANLDGLRRITLP
jgi:sugar phosphate isomerase/epimerase